MVLVCFEGTGSDIVMYFSRVVVREALKSADGMSIEAVDFDRRTTRFMMYAYLWMHGKNSCEPRTQQSQIVSVAVRNWYRPPNVSAFSRCACMCRCWAIKARLGIGMRRNSTGDAAHSLACICLAERFNQVVWRLVQWRAIGVTFEVRVWVLINKPTWAYQLYCRVALLWKDEV